MLQIGKNKRLEKNIPCLVLIKKVGISILISGKLGFRVKVITRNKESFHNDKVAIQVELNALSIFVPNNRASKYMNQKLIELKGDIDPQL